MTREDKLYSMRMVDLVDVAKKLGIKINTKASKSIAVEKILAVEEMNKQNEKELAKEEKEIKKIIEEPERLRKLRNERNKAEDDVLKATAEAVKKIEEPKLVPMPGAEKLAELKDEYAGDGTPLAEVGEEIAEQAKIKAETAKRSKNSNMIEYNGRSQSLTKWAKELGMPVQTLYYRIKMKGWDIEKAFTK